MSPLGCLADFAQTKIPHYRSKHQLGKSSERSVEPNWRQKAS